MSNEHVASIPVKRGMKLGLKKVTPSGYPIPLLKEQLTRMGLVCPETSEEKLMEYREDVIKSFRAGKGEVYGIYKFRRSGAEYNHLFNSNGSYKLSTRDFLAEVGSEKTEANGSWEIDDSAAGYKIELTTLVYAPNFDYLKSNFPEDFNGSSSSKSHTVNEPTSETIKKAFTDVAQTVNSAVLSGIKKEDMISIVSMIFGDNQSENVNDYKLDDVINVFLVSEYSEDDGTAVSVGALSLSYKITITDYKDKSHNKDDRYEDAVIEITARYLSYSDEGYMERDMVRTESKAKMNLFAPLAIHNRRAEMAAGSSVFNISQMPIIKDKVVVYASKPSASRATFNTGLPLVDKGKYADAVIYYMPNIHELGCLDNSESDASSSYSKSVTTGFEFSLGFTISTETSVELDFTIVKAGFKLTVSMSLTSTWNQSHTETISFEVGPRKRAFLYQGALNCAVLRYDPDTREYYYIQSTSNKFLTTAVKTSEDPIN